MNDSKLEELECLSESSAGLIGVDTGVRIRGSSGWSSCTLSFPLFSDDLWEPTVGKICRDDRASSLEDVISNARSESGEQNRSGRFETEPSTAGACISCGNSETKFPELDGETLPRSCEQ